MHPQNVWSGVRTLCIAILLSCLSANPAQADCPAAPLETATDMVVSFLTDSTTQAGPATLFASTVEKGMLVYDGNANALKFCDGNNWLTLADTGGAGANAAGPAGYVQISDGSGGLTYSGNTAGQEFFWDNTNKRLGIGTATPGGNLQIEDTGGNMLVLNGPAGSERELTFSTAGSARWILGANGTAEGGSNAGSDLYLNAYTDAGAFLSTGMFIQRRSGNVGIGTTTPEATALLDLASTTKGFLPPRMTTAQRNSITSPVAGLMIYNSTLGRPQFYDGSQWVSMGVVYDGSSFGSAGASCKAILDGGFSTGNKNYWIQTPSGASNLYCDMTGGGWTRIALDDGSSTTGWSNASTFENEVSGNYAYGRWGNVPNNVSKTYSLYGIPHTQKKVSLDYYAIDSWDVPEQAELWLNGAMSWSLVRTNHSDCSGGWTTYSFGPAPWSTGVRCMASPSVTISDSSNSVVVSVRTTINQDDADESWGFDDVIVWVK